MFGQNLGSSGGSNFNTGNSIFENKSSNMNGNAPSLFSSNGGSSGLNSSNQQNNNNSAPFGSQAPIFGQNNSMLGSNTTNGSNNLGSSYGITPVSNSNNNSIGFFGSNTNNQNQGSFGFQNQQQQNTLSNSIPSPGFSENQSLFNMESAFSFSNDSNAIHDLAEEKLRQSTSSSQIQLSQYQLGTSSLSSSLASSTYSQYPSSQYPANSQKINNSSYGLRHSQSSITLGSGSGLNSSPYRRQPGTPGWAQEKRHIPNQSSKLRHVSSFSKNDRVPSTPVHRKASVSPSQSPSTSFGNSFSGIPKPSHTKKKAFVQEDPPPTRSIYDLDASNPGTFKNDGSTLPLSDKTRLVSFPGSGNSGIPSAKNSIPPSPASSNVSSGTSIGSSFVDTASVIIFGFPASHTPSVVSYFRRFGTILENIESARPLLQTPSKGIKQPQTPIHTGKNWLKITYDNPSSASRAIRENGMMFADKYMIGCVPVTPQRLKEFERACDTSMSAAELRSSEPPFGDTSLRNTVIPEDDSEIEIIENRTPGNQSLLSTDENTGNPQKSFSNKSVFNSQKSLPRTISMPVLAGSKRTNIKDGRHIFTTPAKQMRYSSSLFKATPESEIHKQSNSIGTTVETSKPLQSGKPGWISWTSKKAQELVFGWDDL